MQVNKEKKHAILRQWKLIVSEVGSITLILHCILFRFPDNMDILKYM